MKARTAAIVLVTVTAVAILAVMGWRMAVRYEPSVDIDTVRYTVRGVDVSAHNGDVDFKRLADAGIDFVYIKASEGATWRDARFEENYAAALESGMAVGVYHFFRFDVEGWRQSVNIMRAINGRRLDLPVAIDVEEYNNPTDNPTEVIVKNLRSMVELLRQGGREVIIYTNKNGYHRFVRGHFDDVALWLCSFTDPPLYDDSRWTLWQHSHRGRLEGVEGDVDLNTFNGPLHGEFADYLASRPSISTVNIR